MKGLAYHRAFLSMNKVNEEPILRSNICLDEDYKREDDDASKTGHYRGAPSFSHRDRSHEAGRREGLCISVEDEGVDYRYAGPYSVGGKDRLKKVLFAEDKRGEFGYRQSNRLSLL